MTSSTFNIVHHVFFWLKNSDSEEDKQALIDGIKELGTIEQVKGIHVGLPAATEQRGVVDGSFSVTEMLIFENEADEAIYQSHPKHKAFIEKCGHLWEKVLVYDSRSV
ncbi:Dabb family protein [Portibacter lacus]|uniref:DabB protein n=1 Tax=Portibacter lacus TaxID=1099794 RepID=A0AA37SVC4_9BACT|nr:Dabb family protein [Portibacter lacus]GLR18485.1 DabB protein [Portibacter lacus]